MSINWLASNQNPMISFAFHLYSPFSIYKSYSLLNSFIECIYFLCFFVYISEQYIPIESIFKKIKLKFNLFSTKNKINKSKFSENTLSYAVNCDTDELPFECKITKSSVKAKQFVNKLRNNGNNKSMKWRKTKKCTLLLLLFFIRIKNSSVKW